LLELLLKVQSLGHGISILLSLLRLQRGRP
jgi:hypothetical protein